MYLLSCFASQCTQLEIHDENPKLFARSDNFHLLVKGSELSVEGDFLVAYCPIARCLLRGLSSFSEDF